MGGQALTATELAGVAGISKQTASTHLAKLLDAKLLVMDVQGRHRYFRLADGDVAHLLESLMGLAFRAGAVRLRTGPREPALRQSRMCYDHLAGELGVLIFDGLLQRQLICRQDELLELTPAGAGFFREFGIDIDGLAGERRPLCRSCLDWSMRRHHLAGAIGAALLRQMFELGWARRINSSRVVRFTALGELELRRQFALAD